MQYKKIKAGECAGECDKIDGLISEYHSVFLAFSSAFSRHFSGILRHLPINYVSEKIN
jgi:hypothetical protein